MDNTTTPGNKRDSVKLQIEQGAGQDVSPVKKFTRRPDIDLIRVVLTWGILLYHVVIIYSPYLTYYVKVYPEYIEGWHGWISWFFILSMNAWNMPMFFFLSGIRNNHNLVLK